MSNPRGNISFEGIAAEYATFYGDGVTIVYDATKRDNSAAVGLAATLSDGATVALTADGDAVIGKVVLVEPDGKVNVQVGGFMSLPGGAGASLANGKRIVGAVGAAAAKGYIREVATGTAAELGKQGGVIIDETDATAVVVKL